MLTRHAIFILNLLQDINVVRPLAYLAAQELGQTVSFLVSDKFLDRDKEGSWQKELRLMADAIGAEAYVYDSPYSAYAYLQGKGGVLVAGSESNLSAHVHVHEVFRVAPSSFLKITLQHGLECVGFLQNREHNMAHGTAVTFGADVLAGWCDGSVLRSMAASERSKLYVTGPSTLVPIPNAGSSVAGEVWRGRGLVCENLHSVRHNINGDMKGGFMSTFGAFCERLAQAGSGVTLRPHPGGQYVLKNQVVLPGNVKINNRPMYDVRLGDYAYGISAPSSVLIDMVLAGIPAAVWQDEDAVMDVSNYDGLTTISTIDDWMAFERDAYLRPRMLLETQAAFLRGLKMPTEPADVRRRFARLLSGGGDRIGEPSRPRPKTQRILFVANGFTPTVQLSFIKPVTAMGDDIAWEVLTEESLRDKFGFEAAPTEVGEADVMARLEAFDPTMIVFCRYSGPHGAAICDFARQRGAPVIYHIDDDVLNIPRAIGRGKWRSHNRPERLDSARYLLSAVDLVYCSTPRLLKRFRSLGFRTPMLAGKIYCSGEVLNPAVNRPAVKIGYMGFDHAHDLNLVLPALVEVLTNNPHVTFDLFGSIPKPAALDVFGDRITVVPPVRIYSEFMQAFAALDWDIGICPLAPMQWNRLKANTKWVEYTAVGAAVVASSGMMYEDCCADGCGDLADTHAEWVAAIQRLIDDSDLRHGRVVAAQRRLCDEYSLDRLVEQVDVVFRRASELARVAARGRAGTVIEHDASGAAELV